MLVNGLKLPARLIDLLETGRWKRPADTRMLAEITGAERPEDFVFDDLEGMIRETAGSVQLWQNGYASIYSLTSSSEPTSANPEFLNVDLSVLIAGNWNEEVICLDYRVSLEQPQVVCGIWPDPRRPCQWKVIAPTFEALADYLAL